MAYRFVHAADIHLDSPLKSLALRDPALAELIGNATRQVFVRIVDLCLDERVDALMLAGDLYDGDQTSMKTARFLAEQLRRLDLAGISTFVIRGNHDALSKISRELVLPRTVKLFGGWAEAVTVEGVAGGLDVRVHGLSFAQQLAPESFLPKYKAPVEGAVNIGLMHTSLDGARGHDDYAPCGLADLHGSGFSYWALGHIHARKQAAGSRGGATVVMPGIPQGRDINEAGAKSVTLVTVGDDRGVTVEQRVTSVAQFERVAVNLDGVEDWSALGPLLGAGLAAARAAAASDHLVARLTVTGTTPLAWRLRRDLDLLTEEARLRAAAVGRCWIETVELACRPPAARPGIGDADPLSELHRLIRDDVLRSPAFAAEMTALAEELSGALPQDCRRLLGSGPDAMAAVMAELAAEGAEDVLARLRAAPGTEPG